MAEKRGRGRPPSGKIAETVYLVPDDLAPEAFLSERLRLRQRWELASVLNFLRVFKPLIESDLEASAEEIETALITPNNTLAEIHIALLKGIPPVKRNVMDADAWVTVVCKKLSDWWAWVADGENPLTADHGEEILRYKELDPATRLLILKALCEVRAEQDDILKYISDALKTGTPVTTFRKERLGGDDDGTAYWYDGDPAIGFRLYREVTRVESKPKLKGKGNSGEPTVDTQWETLATNLEEFLEISDNLSSSKITADAAVGEIIKNDIVPVLEEHQLKKERALKQQQRQAQLLDGLLNSSTIGGRNSRRERKPVKYTFDEYDQYIDEAIEISKKPKTIRSHKENNKQREDGSGHQDIVLNGSTNSDKDNSSPDEGHGCPPGDDRYRSRVGDDDDDDQEDDDYDEKDDDHGDSNADDDEKDDLGDSDEENAPSRRTRAGAALNQNVKTEVVAGLRRSRRTAGSTNNFEGQHAEMKKRLRQRPTRNDGYCITIVSDSEDGSLSGSDEQTVMISDPERESSSSATATDNDDDGDDDEPQDDDDDDSNDDEPQDGDDDDANDDEPHDGDDDDDEPHDGDDDDGDDDDE